MSSNPESMTIPELETAIADLTEQQRALKMKKLALHTVLDQKAQEAEAKRRLEQMSDSEKAALLQELQAEGIGSGEAFGQM